MLSNILQIFKIIAILLLATGLFKVANNQEYHYSSIDEELMKRMETNFISLSDHMLLLVKLEQSNASSSGVSQIKKQISQNLEEIAQILMIMSKNNTKTSHFQDYQTHYERWKLLSKEFDKTN